MTEKKYPPPKNLINPFIKNLDEYISMYRQSIENPQTFFGEQAEKNLAWIKPFTSIHNNEFADSKWFEGGKLNITENCLDRHLEKRGNQTAIKWIANNPKERIVNDPATL